MPKENEEVERDEDDAGLADAVSDAVDEVTYHEKIEGEEDDGAADDAGGSADSGDEPEVSDDRDEGSDADRDEEDPEKGGEADEEADESEGADDGEAGDDSAEKGDEEGDDEESGDDGADEPDHLNDPIPEGTNERTRQRIQSLIGDVKELSTARDERNAIMEAITETRATPDQYAGALTVLKLYNSDSIEDKRQALQIIQNMERDLAFDVGEGQRHVKLTDYPDLQAEVEAGTLSEERAAEIAAVRERDKRAQEKRQLQDQQRSGQQQTQELVQQGKSDLNALGQELMADPDYKRLYPQFVQLLNPTLRRVNPAEWKETARDMFNQLKAANPAPQPSPTPNTGDRQRGGKRGQPLRPKSGTGSGGKKSQVGSAVEAIDNALGEL